MRKLLLSLLLTPVAGIAQNPSLDSNIKKINAKLIEWRRYFHQTPELSNREINTAKKVANHLKSLGIEVKTGIAKTGVVGILKGGKPGPVVALRADMDALPVTEQNDLPFKSNVSTEYNGQKVGVMHACGHDAHIAILMSVAEVLSRMKEYIPGTVVFLFQPAEESAPEGEEGGAPLMIKGGVLDNPKVDVVFGMHINSATPVGTIEYKSGAFMAAADQFKIKIKGKGSHGSQPWLGKDPIYISTLIVQALQGVVSRDSDLTKAPVVITVGAINSGIRSNIIPEEAEMIGTIRNLDSAIRKNVLSRVKEIATTIAEMNGATAEVTIETKTLVTYNDPALVKQMLPSLQRAAGTRNVNETQWKTGSEDFSFFQDKVPGFFFYLSGMPAEGDREKAPPHHTPQFFIDDSRLDLGVKAFCQLVFDYAKTKK